MMDEWYYHNGVGYSNFNYVGGLVMMIFILILVGIVVYLLVQNNKMPADKSGELSKTGKSGKSGESDDAIAILEKRFATGEIDEKEFKKRKEVLSE